MDHACVIVHGGQCGPHRQLPHEPLHDGMQLGGEVVDAGALRQPLLNGMLMPLHDLLPKHKGVRSNARSGNELQGTAWRSALPLALPVAECRLPNSTQTRVPMAHWPNCQMAKGRQVALR